MPQLDFTGTKAVSDNLRRIARIITEQQAPKALSLSGQLVMTASKRVCPVDKGTLRASGKSSRPRKVADGWEVELSYGGAASAYALAVHEIGTLGAQGIPLSWKGRAVPIRWMQPGTGSKYLERPVLAYASRMLRDLGGIINASRA